MEGGKNERNNLIAYIIHEWTWRDVRAIPGDDCGLQQLSSQPTPTDYVFYTQTHTRKHTHSWAYRWSWGLRCTAWVRGRQTQCRGFKSLCCLSHGFSISREQEMIGAHLPSASLLLRRGRNRSHSGTHCLCELQPHTSKAAAAHDGHGHASFDVMVFEGIVHGDAVCMCTWDACVLVNCVTKYPPVKRMFSCPTFACVNQISETCRLTRRKGVERPCPVAYPLAPSHDNTHEICYQFLSSHNAAINFFHATLFGVRKHARIQKNKHEQK